VEPAPKRLKGASLIHDEIFADIRGDGAGVLKWDSKLNILSAHCRHKDHGRNCRLNRTLKESDKNDAQGRPVGLLLAWLKCGSDKEFALGLDGDVKAAALKHMAITRGHHKDIAPQLSPVRRVQARRWALGNEDLQAFINERERKKRIGEPDEPDRCP
jgi:hypothetical protein